ncbi:MFS transporter [Rhodococcus erythropolis]|uniref:MFS transporter n=1 Tax=Rhodococcus erythropolis TaxID=1833 RepID=UPI00366BA010
MTAEIASPTQFQRGRRGKNLALLTGSTAMDNAESSVTSVMFPLMREAMGLSSAALGTIVAVSKAVGVFTAIPWAFLARRYSRKSVLAVCSGFWGAWVILAGLSGSFTQFLVLYAIGAAGFAGAGSIALSILGDLYEDARRGRATGLMYGGVAVITGATAPVFGLLARFEDGWRYGYIITGAICIIIGVLILIFLDDPESSDTHPQTTSEDLETKTRFWREGIRELLAIKTYRYILIQRIFSGQNVIMSFSIVFLVEEHGFTTTTASIIAPPFAIGYLVGTFVGGRVNDAVHVMRPRSGRILMLQASQLGFALAALVATQISWNSIGAYAVMFAIVGVLQGQVPVVNRPIIMAVVRPELRALAFAVSLSTVEALAYAGYAFLVGILGDRMGLQGALFIVTVVLTTLNGVASGALYRPYARDSVALLTAVTSLHDQNAHSEVR